MKPDSYGYEYGTTYAMATRENNHQWTISPERSRIIEAKRQKNPAKNCERKKIRRTQTFTEKNTEEQQRGRNSNVSPTTVYDLELRARLQPFALRTIATALSNRMANDETTN